MCNNVEHLCWATGGCGITTPECSLSFMRAAVLDAFGKGEIPGGPHLPPCLVTDTGDYTLAEWPFKRARCAAVSGEPSAFYIISLSHT